MKEFRIHIGAHKTATTHFQDSLFRANERIALQGKDYISRADCRQKKIVQQIYEASAQAPLSTNIPTTLSAILRNNGYNSQTILMSEENIIGSSVRLLDKLYPDIVERLTQFIKLAGSAEIFIFLSIRSYEDLLPSAYSQALRDGASIPHFQYFHNYWQYAKPSWFKLIQALVKLLGTSRLTVWSFERYIRNPSEILEEFSGVNFGKINLSDTKTNSRMTADSVRKILLLDKSLTIKERRIRIKEIEGTSSSDSYDPLSNAEKLLLRERYLEDCDKIVQLGMKIFF